MIKIEAVTLEQAYKDAAASLKCSVTEMAVEVVQAPSSGFLGLFKKPAIIVATIDKSKIADGKEERVVVEAVTKVEEAQEVVSQTFLNDTILPTSFVSDQDEEELEEDLASGLDYTADYDDAFDEENIDGAAEELSVDIDAVAKEVQKEINDLFKLICFEIDTIEVSAYDKETLLIEFKGEDAALLIGKEGYRYKALSYMLFNWINTKYNVQLRLEIAEFLKNQEESVGRYLTSVYENIDRDGRAQTKILDGVLVQIALKELRERYPEKYVVIRSTRDGLKYILVNDYHTN
ncbi:MAG: Jag N-terminal domain-containing protein [Epsilonproteobacteria bacterium]|nr:Jag N-terminal domain-containing protein [Campylobacterota bacterium]